MKILVTGASGSLGVKLVEQLAAKGVSIRCLVRRNTDVSKLNEIKHRYGPDCLEYAVGNLTHRPDVRRALSDIDVVCHLAAELRGLPASLFHNNVVGSRNLLEAALEFRPARIIWISSIAAYEVAGLDDGSTIDEGFSLERFPERRDIYTHTKVWQERLVQDYGSRATLQCVILRPGVIYGESRDPLFARLGIRVGNFWFRLAAEVALPLSYVDNCASAVAFAINPRVCEGVYNVLDDDTPTARAYLRQYQQYVGTFRSLRIPRYLTIAFSRFIETCSRHSHGEIPAFLTPYKVKSTWTSHRFTAEKFKAAGWKQWVPTTEALRRTFHSASLTQSSLPHIGRS